MLRGFREGLTQEEVFQDALGLNQETFDRDFADWAKKAAADWVFDLTPPEKVEELRDLAEKDPDNAAVHGRLARAWYDVGKYDDATKAARRAMELDENEPLALEVLAKAHARNLRSTNDPRILRDYETKALPTLERLLKVDPDSWTALKTLGEIALRRKEWDRAARMFTRLQRLCPMDPASWKGLAGVHLDRGQNDLALPQLLELARLEAEDVDVPAQIAGIYRRKGRIREAEYWYRRALHIDPFSVDVHDSLGDVLMEAGQTEAALGQYLVLTRIEPDNAGHFESAATAAFKMGDAERAEELARAALAIDPSSSARSLLR
jgi:tetratricopeptide (TPR) repeat protein